MVPHGGPRLSPQTCRNLIATCSNYGSNRNLLLPGAARTSRLARRKRSIRAPSEPDKRCLAEVAGHGERSATPLHLTLEPLKSLVADLPLIVSGVIEFHH